MKSEQELRGILDELLKNEENECVEFKRAESDFDIDKLGKYFSAISNETTLKNKQYGWIVFGIDDKTHNLINTHYRYDNNFNRVKKEISDNTTGNITFIEVYVLLVDEKRVVMFQVPAATGMPVSWKGIPYGRNGESLSHLGQNKIDQIKAIANYDFTRRIIEDATIDNLDKNAILKAREQFKLKYPDENVDRLSDVEFLNKAKLTIDGKITYAAMLLLGNNDYDYLMEEYNTRITWKLCEGLKTLDYEHFGIPFIINVEKAKNKIRNLRYRYMVNDNSLFPNEVDQYDNYILRELINNCIAHQDYRLRGYINIIEYSDRLIITNEGNFIPETVENVLKNGYSPTYYRNPFLATAMVNLNMIDTIGSGIRKVFDIQVEKYFPLPDYNLNNKNRVEVTLYGKIIDENYSKLLFEKTNLDIIDVMLLDRVQKKYDITKEQSDYLKKKELIEGRYPNIYISSYIAELTDKKVEYIEAMGLNNSFYMDYILEYIRKFGFATRKEINDFIKPRFPSNLSPTRMDNKVRYLLRKMRADGKIYNEGSDRLPIWVINKGSNKNSEHK